MKLNFHREQSRVNSVLVIAVLVLSIFVSHLKHVSKVVDLDFKSVAVFRTRLDGALSNQA